MNRFALGLALLVAVVGAQSACGQYTVYYPAATPAYEPVTTYYAPAPAPVTTYYAPASQPVTTYYAPAPRPVTTYYAPAPQPVTTYYAPAPAPVTTYYAPAPVAAAPTTYVTRYRPLLGGSVTTAYYGNVPMSRTYVNWRY